MNDFTFYGILIGFIVLIILMIIQGIFVKIFNTNIDIFDDNVIKIIKKNM